jgi:hypothetical protein
VAVGAETEVGTRDGCYVSVGGLLYFYSVSDSASADMEENMLTGMVVLGRRLIPNTPLSSGLSVFPVIGSRLGNRV